MKLIVLDSSSASRRLWKVFHSNNIEEYKVVFLKYFRDFPKQTPKGTKKETLGIDLENDFDILWDTEQSAINNLMKDIYSVDDVYLGFAGHTSEYKSFLVRRFIKEKFPFKNMYRVKFTGFTKERVLKDISLASEDDFDEIFYEKELALRVADRLSRYFINNKLRSYKINFPGITSYYILSYIIQHQRGANVIFGKDKNIFKHFKSLKVAKAFSKKYKSSKLTKAAQVEQYDFTFYNNHFLRNSSLLKQFPLDLLEEGLWYLYSNGYITDPTRLLNITDAEYSKCTTKLELFSGYFNNRNKNKKGIYVTNINLAPDKVYFKFQNLYRHIWRSTLAAFSKSCKGTKHVCFYGMEEVGYYRDINYDGFTRFLKDVDNAHVTPYHSFDSCSVQKPKVSVEDILAHFGYRGSYCLKELAKASFIVIKDGNISVQDSAKVMVRVLDNVYSLLFKFFNPEADSFILREILEIKTVSDRIAFLTKLALHLNVPSVNFDLPVCPECDSCNLRLSIGTTPMLVCKAPKSGGCGSVFSVVYKKGKFVVKE